jgi:hypothetical protein
MFQTRKGLKQNRTEESMDNLIEHLLAKDLKKATKTLSLQEIRYLVDTYYLMQDQRKRSSNQVRDLSKANEPFQVIQWTQSQFHELEKTVARVLDYWTRDKELGIWCRGIVGIGPVITAGLMSHINLNPWSCAHVKDGRNKKPCTPEEPHGPECHHIKVNTAGHIWRFAGLDPTQEWKAKEKRPWNAALKTLCWKIDESFVKVSGNPESLYGRLYLDRKTLETARNEQLLFKDQAVEKLKKFNIGKGTEAYKWYSVGKLPPGHIHARAKRYAVKIFLSHYHAESYELEFGEKAPAPYALGILGHADYIGPEVPYELDAASF